VDSHEHDISKRPWGNFLKFGMNVHLDSTLNWLDLVVIGQGPCALTKHVVGHNSIIYMLIMTKFKKNVSFGTNGHLGSMGELIWVWLSKVKDQDQDHCDLELLILLNVISQEWGNWGNFLKFGINVHLDLMMNSLDFDDKRSRSLWPCICSILVNTISQECAEGISLNVE